MDKQQYFRQNSFIENAYPHPKLLMCMLTHNQSFIYLQHSEKEIKQGRQYLLVAKQIQEKYRNRENCISLIEIKFPY